MGFCFPGTLLNWRTTHRAVTLTRRTQPLRSLRVKLGAALGLVAAVSVLLITVVQTVSQVQDLHARTLAQTQLAASLASNQVGDAIITTLRELAMVAADPKLIEDLQADDIASMDARLEAMAPADPDLTAIVVIDTRPRVRAISLLDKKLFDSDYSDQLHVQTVLGQGTPGIGRPRLGLITGLPIVPLGVPIRAPDGQLIGVLQGSLSLQKLTAELAAINLGDGGALTLVAGDGTVLAHPDPNRILKPSAGLNNAITESLKGYESASETRNDAGVPVFAAAVPVSGVGWVTEAEIPVAETQTPLRDRLLTTLVVGILVFVAASVLGAILSRLLAAPVAVLQAATRRMAKGEYLPGSLAIHSGDELEELATDFEQMVAKVQESEERYRTVSELTSDFSYAFSVTPDRSLVPLWVTDAFTRITGYSIEELAEKGGWYGVVHPSDLPIAERRRNVLFAGQSDVSEFRIVTKSGEERSLRVHARPVWDAEQERVVRFFGAAEDITEQQRLEAQIRDQNRELSETTSFLNNVLESSTEHAIIATSLDGHVLAWNEGAYRSYGYSAEEMIGTQRVAMLFCATEADRRSREALFAAASRTGAAEGVFEHVRKTGERFTASVAVTLRRDVSGDPVGYLLISKDITQQKALEAQLQRKNEELEEQYHRLQEANRLKSEFLANMSHELRTPLNGIIGFAELMHDEKVGPISADHKEYLGDILISSQHLLQLINDVLDLAKVESGKMDFNPEPVDMIKIVAEVRDILRTLAASKQIPIEVWVDPEVQQVIADPGRLKQVLYNYLSNAIKFTPDEGEVTVRVLAEGAVDYRIEVQDTGIGVAPEDMDRLFAEFEQLDASSAKKYQGTGLGLALTKRLVEAQGGTVGVESSLGAGSTFSAVLPRTMVSSWEEPKRNPSPGRIVWEDQSNTIPGVGPVALVIDDHAADRAMLARVLSEVGYLVFTAGSGAEALAKCQKQAFDLITLDLLLPDMPGSELLEQIRTLTPARNTPVIVVSVLAQADLELDSAVSESLLKPVKDQALLAALDRVKTRSYSGSSVLVVDDDAQSRHLLEVALSSAGFTAVCVPEGEIGLRVARETCVGAIVLDLAMPGMDGFEFVDILRRTMWGRAIPIIVMTSMELTNSERERLHGAVADILPKGEKSVSALLTRLERWVRPSEPPKVMPAEVVLP